MLNGKRPKLVDKSHYQYEATKNLIYIWRKVNEKMNKMEYMKL
jgi:hypothetical protein